MLKRIAHTRPSWQSVRFRRARQRPGRVGVCGGREAAPGVTRGVAASSTDLGGSSKYSRENLERRSGARFHENSIWS